MVALAIDELRPRQSALQHSMRDLTLLDGALARLATALQRDVADRDTDAGSGSATAPEAGAGVRQ